MAITPFDKLKLTDKKPDQLKSLVDERLAERTRQEGIRDAATKAIQSIDAELKNLQDESDFQFGKRERPPVLVPRDPKSGERLDKQK